MKRAGWIIGALLIVAALLGIAVYPLPSFLFPEEPFIQLAGRALLILLLAAGMCLYRIARGPTAADRIVAVDILGILIVGFCAILSVSTGRSWYMDIGIAWALQSFISTLALSKHLEGKGLEE